MNNEELVDGFYTELEERIYKTVKDQNMFKKVIAGIHYRSEWATQTKQG